MLMESMGVDPTKLQQNVDAALAHVKSIDDRLTRIEQAAAIILNNTGAPITQMVQSCLRIEDAILQLRTDAENTKGFIAEVEKEMPNAAREMQAQLSPPEKEPSYANGKPADNNADTNAGIPTGSRNVQ